MAEYVKHVHFEVSPELQALFDLQNKLRREFEEENQKLNAKISKMLREGANQSPNFKRKTGAEGK